MEIFTRHKKVRPLDIFNNKRRKTVKINVSSEDLTSGVNKQLKRIKDPNFQLQELVRILPEKNNAELHATLKVASKGVPRKPKRLNIPEQIEVLVSPHGSAENNIK